MFYILDLSFLLLSAIEFLRNSAIQVKFIIIIYYFKIHSLYRESFISIGNQMFSVQFGINQNK